jgi:hypothetical protein
VDYAEKAETPPPAELRLAWMCGDQNLPSAGGVLDQEYQTMHRMQVLSNVYRTVTRFRNMKGAEIHSLSDQDRRMIRSLRDMGLMNRR